MKKIIYLVGLLLMNICVIAQQATIKGRIQTSDGSPAADVNIILNTQKATIAAQDGSYVLRNIAAGTHQLRVSFAGLQTIEKEVIISSDQTLELNFTIYETAR